MTGYRERERVGENIAILLRDHVVAIMLLTCNHNKPHLHAAAAAVSPPLL